MRPQLNRSRLFIILTCLLFAALAACGGVEATPSPIVSDTPTTAPADTATAAPTATSEPPTAMQVPPTATDVPPTATAVPPTATTAPVATATPAGGDTAGPDLSSLSWQHSGVEGKVIGALAMLRDGNTVLAAGPDGVWISAPPYSTWQPATMKLDFSGPARLFALAAGDGVIYLSNYAGCAAGLPTSAYRSTDGGATWRPMSSDVLDIAATDGQIAYATTCSGISKTTDGGATWQELPGSSAENYDPVALTTSADGQTVVAAYASEGGTGRIMISADGGATWQEKTPGAGTDDQLFGPHKLIYVPGTRQAGDLAGIYVSSMQGIWFLPNGGDWQLLKQESVLPGAGSSNLPFYIQALYVDVQPRGPEGMGPAIYAAAGSGSDVGDGPVVYAAPSSSANWRQVGHDLPPGADAYDIIGATHGANGGKLLLLATSEGVWSFAAR